MSQSVPAGKRFLPAGAEIDSDEGRVAFFVFTFTLLLIVFRRNGRRAEESQGANGGGLQARCVLLQCMV